MNNNNLVVDMESSTPIDEYRFKSVGAVNIYYSKGLDKKYSLLIDYVGNEKKSIDNITSSLINLWHIIEAMRSKARSDNMIVNVIDKDAGTRYSRITLATTLNQVEKAEALDRQIKLARNTRRRMVVQNKYHSRKRKTRGLYDQYSEKRKLGSNMRLDKKDILLIKKALRLCMYKFDRRGQDYRNIDDRILANRFEKVLDKIKIPTKEVIE